MKFKDKDGNVFEDIWDAFNTFCKESPTCFYCGKPFQRKGPGLCFAFAQRHPAEAARLMGYEVIREPGIDFPMPEYDPDDVKLGPFFEKETNTGKQKPRICEVLGVEAGQRFNINYPHREYDGLEVRADGKVWETGRTVHKLGVNALCYLIENPDRIIRDEKCATCAYENPSAICVNCGSKHWHYQPKEEPMSNIPCKQKPIKDWTLEEVKDWCRQYMRTCDNREYCEEAAVC